MYTLSWWVLAVAAALTFVGPATNFIEAIATIGVVETLFSIAGCRAVRLIVALVRRSPLRAVDRILGTIPVMISLALHRRGRDPRIEALPIPSEMKAASKRVAPAAS